MKFNPITKAFDLNRSDWAMLTLEAAFHGADAEDLAGAVAYHYSISLQADAIKLAEVMEARTA